jgi:class 3 adenylate cyclase/tetratricopeptide (TPR) repeat protein
MQEKRRRLQAAISAIEAQRTVLGDEIADVSIAALRHQLDETTPQFIEQQRKQITVLFADVSGFTAMAAEMDAEEVGNIMNTLWQRIDRVINKHGGYIDKHFGDGVMALWGVQTAREEDPERAIHAALAMQDELVAFRQEVHQDLAMRIGLNTGPVLLGQVGETDEFTAIGDTVNTAERLEKVAPVSTVFITHNTYQHVRGVFDVLPMEPISVRGKPDPLRVYTVSRAKVHSFHSRQRGVEGVETRMIGRAGEMRLLKETFKAVIAKSQFKAITITGAAGLGKSRLLYEFENWADLLDFDIFFLRGRARQEERQVPFALLRDIFAFRFGIREDDPPQIVREKLKAGFCETIEPLHKDIPAEEMEMRAQFLGHLLGFHLGPAPHCSLPFNDPKQMRDRAFIYLLEYIQNAATSDPLLLMIEDLHWADDSSLDILEMVGQRMSGFSLFVLAATRPLFFERRPHWISGIEQHRRLDLRPLSILENRNLVYEILKLAEDVPTSVHEMIIENSQGNPFYAEELVKMLIDEGVINKGEERWTFSSLNLAETSVPPTLTGIIQARLDNLTPVQKSIVQQASIIGRVFWDTALIYLNEFSQDPLNKDEIQEALVALRQRELISKRNQSDFSHSTEYIFNHAILREVAYESVLLRNRGLYHGLTADWLRAQSGKRSVGMVGLTADHLYKAGRSTEAIADLQLAGKQAAVRFANEEAKAYFSRALELVPSEDKLTRFQLLLDREAVFDKLGNREEQKSDLETLQEIARSFGTAEMARVYLRRASYEEAIADYEAMLLAATNALDFVSEDGPPLILSRGYLDLGLALERLGKFREAHEQLLQALHAARTGGESHLAGLALCGLGIVARAMGNHKNAYHYYEDALAQFVDLGDLSSQSSTLIWLGVLATDMGDFTRARSCYEQALDLTSRTGYRYHESFALSNLGSNANYQGDYTRAISFIEQALVIAREIDNRLVECLCLNNLGTVNLNLENYQASKANYEKSLGIALNTGHRRMEASASTGVGLALLKMGETVDSIAPLNRAIQIRRELEEIHLYESLAILSYAYQILGNQDLSFELAEEVLGYLQNGGKFFMTEYGLGNYLYLLDTLESSNDPRAGFILDRAYHEFLQFSERIPDEPTRHAFLHNVPSHREIVNRWQKAS